MQIVIRTTNMLTTLYQLMPIGKDNSPPFHFTPEGNGVYVPYLIFILLSS
jgi:hypothetical protein